MAEHRHRAETRTHRVLHTRPNVAVVAAPLAVLATVGAVSLGLLSTGGPTARPEAASDATAPTTAIDAAGDETTGSGPATVPGIGPIAGDLLVAARPQALSRGADRLTSARTVLSPAQKLMRPDRVAKAIRTAIADGTQRYSTTQLNLWTDPTDAATNAGELDSGTQVLLTGRSMGGRDEIVVGKHASETRWVTSGYLSADKPLAAASGLSMAPCPDPGVEYRLTPGAVYVYRSVCHAFPQITTYGGFDEHGEHASGKALDIMTSDPALLTTIGDFLRAHAAELDLYDVIRLQHIWTPVRSPEGWRLMPDRGSATANHYDHVHVSVN